MGSAYLSAADLSVYGVPTATLAQVAEASSLIDVYCGRPRTGLVYATDATGAPAYMAGATPELQWSAAAAISPGSNVVVTVTGPPLYAELIGRPVVLGWGGTGSIEAAVISAINATAGTLTLGSVQFTHAAPVTLASGVHVFEERNLPQDRSLARVAQWPVQRVVSGLGRYSYGRRSQQVQGNYSEFNLLAILQQFGGPPAWVQLDVTQLGVNPTTGELWIPAGLLLAYYSDVRLYYVAGWPAANLPQAVKVACVNIIRNYLATAGTPAASGLFRRVAAGNTALERVADAAMDDETKRLLQPFRAHLFV